MKHRLQMAALLIAWCVLLAVFVPFLPWWLTEFMPHNHCYGNDPWIFWPYVLGHFLTAAAYFWIPAQIWAFHVKEPDALPRWAATGYAAFILACGVGHTLEGLSHWMFAAYRVHAWWGFLVTAPVSLGVAVMSSRAFRTVDGLVKENKAAVELFAEARSIREDASNLRDVVTRLRLSAMLEDVPGFVWISTDGEYVTGANRTLIDLLGEDPTGMHVRDEYLPAFTSDEFQAPTADYHEEMAADADTRPMQYALPLGPRGCRDEDRVWVTWFSRSLNGQSVGRSVQNGKF